MMIKLYCRRKEGNKFGLCQRCQALLDYANMRLERCPVAAEDKISCRMCTIHCYSAEMRQSIREVMRWAGPRMMLYHPVEALRHLYYEKLKR
mgnify:FL=1